MVKMSARFKEKKKKPNKKTLQTLPKNQHTHTPPDPVLGTGDGEREQKLAFTRRRYIQVSLLGRAQPCVVVGAPGMVHVTTCIPVCIQ